MVKVKSNESRHGRRGDLLCLYKHVQAYNSTAVCIACMYCTCNYYTLRCRLDPRNMRIFFVHSSAARFLLISNASRAYIHTRRIKN